jgi:gas vesicle protein
MAERDSFSSFIIGFIAGGIAGAIATVLYAPKSGAETRNALKEKKEEILDKANLSVDEAYKQAEMAAKYARDRFEALANTTKSRAEEVTRRGQVFLEERKNQLKGLKNELEKDDSAEEIPTIPES